MAHAEVRQFAPPPFRPVKAREDAPTSAEQPREDLSESVEHTLSPPTRLALIFFFGIGAWIALGMIAYWLVTTL